MPVLFAASLVPPARQRGQPPPQAQLALRWINGALFGVARSTVTLGVETLGWALVPLESDFFCVDVIDMTFAQYFEDSHCNSALA